MNILVTGGAGFIGSHFANHLASNYQYYNVIVMDKMDYCASLNNLDLISNKNLKFVKGDITNIDFVSHLLEKEKINVIAHFAAQTHVDNSFGNSFSFTHNNIYGTHVLLECSKKYGKIARFLHVSTDEVYGETNLNTEFNFPEYHLLKPTNPYSATKASSEMLVHAYKMSYNLPVVITRGNNVYGPRQYPEKLIPKFCMKALAGEKLPVHGKGKSKRCFIYIDDVVEAYDTILHLGQNGEIYNIGTKDEKSVNDVAEYICNKMNLKTDEKVEFVEDRPFNDCRYFIEYSKLTSLGWEPKTTWDDGMEKTIDFYKKFGSDWWSTSST